MIDKINLAAQRLTRGESATDLFFNDLTTTANSIYKSAISKIHENDMAQLEREAISDLKKWSNDGARQVAYTPTQLANARLCRDFMNTFLMNNAVEFRIANALHMTATNYVVEQTLSQRMIEEGQKNRKLSVVELSSRIAPALTFPGASNYLSTVIIPYGKEARKQHGEGLKDKLISSQQAQTSAINMYKRFDSQYVLAETSSAPRSDVPKGGRKPEIFIHTISDHTEHAEHHTIDTLFRDVFDATAREIMYQNLVRMYLK